MRIVFIASNFGNTWGTETHLAREFEALGHEVHKLSERLPYHVLTRHAQDCDAVFYMKALGMEHGAQLWDDCRRVGVPTASYHLDLYYGLRRGSEIGNDPMWRTDFVFTADGDPGFADYCADRDINHHWMPGACVTDEIMRGKIRPLYEHDIVFTGMLRNYHPEWPWREQMLDAMKRRYDRSFVAYSHVDCVRDMELNDMCRSARVVLGDSLSPTGHTNYWSDRYYEVVGRGGLLVAPEVPGIETQFTDSEHLLFYEPRDEKSLYETIDYALSLGHDVREQIITDGMQHVRDHHTYRHRALAMLTKMGLA